MLGLFCSRCRERDVHRTSVEPSYLPDLSVASKWELLEGGRVPLQPRSVRESLDLDLARARPGGRKVQFGFRNVQALFYSNLVPTFWNRFRVFISVFSSSAVCVTGRDAGVTGPRTILVRIRQKLQPRRPRHCDCKCAEDRFALQLPGWNLRSMRSSAPPSSSL